MAKKKADKEPKFSKDELVSASYEVFKEKPEVVAGSLHGVKETTLDDARKKINKFLGKEVK